MPNPPLPDPTFTTLDRVPLGSRATVTHVDVIGPERRRLLDLGVLPGVPITPELRSPLRDPTAYRVRDALIALRAHQARAIGVRLEPAPQEAPRQSPRQAPQPAEQAGSSTDQGRLPDPEAAS